MIFLRIFFQNKKNNFLNFILMIINLKINEKTFKFNYINKNLNF